MRIPEVSRLKDLKRKMGTYVLIFNLESGCRLSVGKLGRFEFPVGWYAYTGSARGPGGLTARLGHHLRIAANPHWHMDFLRPQGSIIEIWYGHDPAFDEHIWAEVMQAMAGTLTVAPGFGSSDCRCNTHLIHFATQPTVDLFRRRQNMRTEKRRQPVFRLPIHDV